MSWISSQGPNICLELPFVPEHETGQMRLQTQKRQALGQEFKETRRLRNRDLARSLPSLSSPLWRLHQSAENENEQVWPRLL